MKGIEEKESGSGHDPGATLLMQARAGCSDSLNELLQRHEGLVHLVVQRQWLLNLPYEEALQAGRMGLWRAILGYNPKQGIAFSTYAYKAIMRHVWNAVKSERRRLRCEVPLKILMVYWYEVGEDPARRKEEEEIRESLQELVQRLPKRLEIVIRAYYGLDGEKRQSLLAIGAELGLSGERIRQLRNEALVWLSQPGHSQALRSLLARHSQTQYELADRMAQAWLKWRGGRNGRQ